MAAEGEGGINLSQASNASVAVADVAGAVLNLNTAVESLRHTLERLEAKAAAGLGRLAKIEANLAVLMADNKRRAATRRVEATERECLRAAVDARVGTHGFPHMSMKGGRWAAAAVTGVLSEVIAAHTPAGMEADAFRQRLCSACDISDVLRGIINDDWSRRIKLSRTFWSHQWRLVSQPGGAIPAAVHAALPSQLPPKRALAEDSRARTVAQFVATLRMTQADEPAARAVFGDAMFMRLLLTQPETAPRLNRPSAVPIIAAIAAELRKPGRGSLTMVEVELPATNDDAVPAAASSGGSSGSGSGAGAGAGAGASGSGSASSRSNDNTNSSASGGSSGSGSGGDCTAASGSGDRTTAPAAPAAVTVVVAPNAVPDAIARLQRKLAHQAARSKRTRDDQRASERPVQPARAAQPAPSTPTAPKRRRRRT